MHLQLLIVSNNWGAHHIGGGVCMK